MRDSGKPAVVHNGMFDLHYSLQSFAGYLPRRWGEFKAMAMDWFPGEAAADAGNCIPQMWLVLSLGKTACG